VLLLPIFQRTLFNLKPLIFNGVAKVGAFVSPAKFFLSFLSDFFGFPFKELRYFFKRVAKVSGFELPPNFFYQNRFRKPDIFYNLSKSGCKDKCIRNSIPKKS
jgi:hypothetical protein